MNKLISKMIVAITFLVSFMFINGDVIFADKAREQTVPNKSSIAPTFKTISYNSEYDFSWKQTGNNLEFELEGVDNNQIVARYITKQGNSFPGASFLQIGIHNANDVRAMYGTKNATVLRGENNYKITDSKEFNFYLINDYYVSFFYDNHKNNVIRSILFVHKDYEVKKNGFYGDVTNTQDHSEQLMVELMNQSRAREGVHALKHSQQWVEIARKHSKDMYDNNYFSHISLSGTTPYDRMIRGGMNKGDLKNSGENLSFGHYNVIYAHEALMNSKGHRNNILNSKYKHAIVGLEYSNEKRSYFTVKFY